MQRTWIKETPEQVGQTICVKGWVHRLRQMGDKLVFVDLRDGSSLMQVVFYKPELDAATQAVVDELKNEFVLEVVGVVKQRGEKQINPDMQTGTVELAASRSSLNCAKVLPFEIDRDT
jgi:aspartyl-tRNA synthetase